MKTKKTKIITLILIAIVMVITVLLPENEAARDLLGTLILTIGII